MCVIKLNSIPLLFLAGLHLCLWPDRFR